MGFFIVVCGDDDGDDTASGAAPAPMGGATTPPTDAAAETTVDEPTAPTEPAGANAELLSFATRTVDGGEVDASELAGRDVVVWFWSPWCGSCAGEADGVGRVAAELGDDVAFLGIAGNADQGEYEEFLADHGPLESFPQLVDETGEIWLRFGADTIRSSFFFLDDTGETSVTGYGEIDEDELRERAEALVAT